MAKINLEDFFVYFKQTKEQSEAISILEDALQEKAPGLLLDNSEWVKQFRAAPAAPAPGASVFDQRWAVTKEQMGRIMNCSTSALPDSLMDDYTACVTTFQMSRLEQGYFLGQCGHESCGLRYPLEIASGADYEWRDDLGNVNQGDGVKFAGTGFIQVTGRYWHQQFSDYLAGLGQFDPSIMEIGKTHTCEHYPWSISGFWWKQNNMKTFCEQRQAGSNYQIDEVGARVNGKMRPNGADDRLVYTRTAFDVLGL